MLFSQVVITTISTCPIADFSHIHRRCNPWRQYPSLKWRVYHGIACRKGHFDRQAWL